jgi:polyhydroxybutyrate depolymerase
LIGVFLLAVAFLVVFWLLWLRRVVDGWHTINVNGLQRRYLLRSSDRRARRRPVLICFHGGGGRIEWLARRTGITQSAQRQGWIVVFPEAKDRWIDARPECGGSARDLDFVDALLDSLVNSNRVDPFRVFAFGVSNGGLLVFRLGCERPSRFAGLATAFANMPVVALSVGSGPPVPIAVMFGRRDRVMPFEGGRIMRRPGLGVGGEVVSAQETVRFWLRRNRAEGTAQLRCLASAGHSVDVEDYSAGPGGAPVKYLVINDCGHGWPRRRLTVSGSSDTFNPVDLVIEFFSGLC